MCDEEELQLPELNGFAIYFPRHGHFQEWQTAEWTNHPQFGEIRDWFFDHIK